MHTTDDSEATERSAMFNRELTQHLELEKVLIDISRRAMSSEGLSDFQTSCLKTLGTTLDLSRVYIFEHNHATDTMDNTYEWTNHGVAPQKEMLQNIAVAAMPWWTEQMKRNQVINLEDIEQIPSESEKALLRVRQIKSLLVVPMYVAQQYHGFIGFDECRRKRRWRSADVNILLAITRIMTWHIERIQSERALAESEHKYRQLFEMESDAIFLIANETGDLLEANAACQALYGYRRDQLLRMKNTDLSAEPDQTRKATVGGLDKVPVRYHRKKDGTVFPVEITARHFTWQGRAVHVAAIRDISSRMAAEQKRDELEAQLRQAQKMESIGTLAGGIAHDFNNILAAIMGYTELAMMDQSRSDSGRDDLQEVLNASQRAKSLVAQILAFSRQSKFEFGPLQLRMIAAETVKMLRATLPAAIEIDFEADTDGVVMADANQMQQVVMNLCTNAYHAMKPQGGRLRIELTEIDLDSAASQKLNLDPGRFVRLVVRDTGTGMDPHTMQRVFEPYFTTKEKGEGTGLGLSMAYGIVKTHKGAIVVESKLDTGSAFSVYLPRLVSQAARVATPPSEPLACGHEQILYVDDEPELVKMTKLMLERAGYQVTTRTSALEALELFRQAPARFDLVLTDLNMPHLSGDALARQMLRIRSDLPIVLCTGFSEMLTNQDLAAAGIRAVAHKPLLLAELSKIIRSVLDACPLDESTKQGTRE